MSKKILKADFVFGYVIRDVNLLYWNKCIAAMKKGKKMERYKVILVDDEAEVIDMIEKKIHWNDLGFEVAGSATNGVKALELVEKLQPDVVLTDIKMPYMDGLELSRRLNREYPNIYIMLCTGFDEFEYAKEAVHLEIKEYMLKPVNATELSESLTNLKHTLDREREEKLNVKKLNDYFQEVLPKLQSNFFISLIEGRVEKKDYERFLQAYQVDMKGPLFGCVIFHTSENHVPEGMNPLLLSMSVEREIKQRLMDQWNCREFIYMGNTLLILELDAEDKITQITDACDRFCGGRTASWVQLLQRESEPCVTACMRSVFPMNGQEKQFLTGFYTEQNGQLILERLFRRNRSNRFSQKSQGCRCYFVQFV